jgi:hypothetical protein
LISSYRSSGPAIQFLLRSIDKVKAEWAMICIAHNLAKLAAARWGETSLPKKPLQNSLRLIPSPLPGQAPRTDTCQPGAVDTPIIDGQFESKEEADSARAFFSGITPLGRIGRSEEKASAILLLASDAISYSTGFDLVAVGGIAQVWVRRFGPRAFAQSPRSPSNAATDGIL